MQRRGRAVARDVRHPFRRSALRRDSRAAPRRRTSGHAPPRNPLRRRGHPRRHGGCGVALRGAAAAHLAHPDVPAVEAGARQRHQNGVVGRGRRRVVRRLHHLQGRPEDRDRERAAAADSASFVAIANSRLAASYLALAALATAVNCFKVKFALLNLAAAASANFFFSASAFFAASI